MKCGVCGSLGELTDATYGSVYDSGEGRSLCRSCYTLVTRAANVEAQLEPTMMERRLRAEAIDRTVIPDLVDLLEELS